MLGLWLTLVLGGGIDRFTPCRAGLTVEYRDARGEAYSERVLGHVVPREPRLCAVERRRAGRAETWCREHLHDRVSNAGWLDTLVAARAPILRAPLVEGAAWVWNRQRTRVVAVGRPIDVPAGHFEDTVWLVSEAADGAAVASESVYAAGVGLIRHRAGDVLVEATRVLR